jgi:hypothetical protein
MDPKLSAELHKIVDLLGKLGQANGSYPFHLLSQRRTEFMTKVAEIRAMNAHSGNGSSGGNGLAAASAKETLIQGLLVTVLVAEIAVGAYVLRDSWLPLLTRNATPTAVHIAPAPQNTAAIFVPVEEEIPTEITTGTVSPVPPQIPVTGEESAAPPTAAPAATAVPAATEVVAPTKPGLHLGQTPGAPGSPPDRQTEEPSPTP